MDEEQAFWMLSSLLESFLPLDYYTKLLGVLVDHNVLNVLIEDRLPEIYEHF